MSSPHPPRRLELPGTTIRCIGSDSTTGCGSTTTFAWTAGRRGRSCRRVRAEGGCPCCCSVERRLCICPVEHAEVVRSDQSPVKTRCALQGLNSVTEPCGKWVDVVRRVDRAWQGEVCWLDVEEVDVVMGWGDGWLWVDVGCADGWNGAVSDGASKRAGAAGWKGGGSMGVHWTDLMRKLR